MKKLVIAAMLLSSSWAAPALADHTPQHAFKGMTFDNRGQCERALAQYRNEARGDHATMSNAEYNRYFNNRFYCDMNRDGDWVVKINNDD